MWPAIIAVLGVSFAAARLLNGPRRLDSPSTRREVMAKFRRETSFYDKSIALAKKYGVRINEEFVLNAMGMRIYTRHWLPGGRGLKGLVFFCHGYGDQCSYFFEETAVKLAAAGFGVFSLDMPGHGQSDGLHIFISDYSDLVEDCRDHFWSVRGSPEYKDKPCFIMGESMGGATAIQICRLEPDKWDGAIFLAPMCKIADKVKPPRVLVNTLIFLSKFFPKWPIVPSEDISELAFKLPDRKQMAKENPTAPNMKPRLGTAVSLLTVSEDIERHLDEVTLPFLLLHGAADTVTDPKVSEALYEQAKSTDKTFKLYDGMWHGLLEGEPEENVNLVMHDMLSWLDKHSQKEADNFVIVDTASAH